MNPGDACSPLGSGTLKKLGAPSFTFSMVVLGLCDGFLGPCSILVTQDKRQGLIQRCIRWAGHVNELLICAGIRARDGSSMPSGQIKDRIVTAGHLGRDEDLLLLLCALAASCWTRRALCVCTQCPTEGGWQHVVAPDSLSRASSSISVLSLLPTLCSHRPAESLHNQSL